MAVAEVKRMKRASKERPCTVRVWRKYLASRDRGHLACAWELQSGRFRKGRQIGGAAMPDVSSVERVKFLGVGCCIWQRKPDEMSVGEGKGTVLVIQDLCSCLHCLTLSPKRRDASGKG